MPQNILKINIKYLRVQNILKKDKIESNKIYNRIKKTYCNVLNGE